MPRIVMQQNIARNLGRLLQRNRWRRRRPWNLHQLSLASGIGYAACWRTAHGKTMPSTATVAAYCRALGCGASDIVDYPGRDR